MPLLRTNYNSALAQNGGDTWAPANTTVDKIGDLLRRFATILAHADSRWTEVTGSAPTPTFLQPFASNAAAGSTAAGQHVTFYLNDDVGLAAGTPYARLFRLADDFVSRRATRLQILDTRHGSTWQSVNTESNPFDYAAAVQGPSSGTAYTEHLRVFVFETANALAVRTTLINDLTSGRGWIGLYYPEPPADGHVTRAQIAPLYAMLGTGNQGLSNVLSNLLAPVGTAHGGGDFGTWGVEGGGLAAGADGSSRNILQRVNPFRTAGPPAFLPFADGWQICRPGVFTHLAEVDDVSGEFVVAAATFSDYALLVPSRVPA